ncbi:MAG TPA: hypothetical protein PKJ40_06605 [Plasticicumulans sp.]|nr:hypothetical protein [Plasticicumulans sp.]HNM43100.1 hypothetical protein [Plasticicumulans sp.]
MVSVEAKLVLFEVKPVLSAAELVMSEVKPVLSGGELVMSGVKPGFVLSGTGYVRSETGFRFK